MSAKIQLSITIKNEILTLIDRLIDMIGMEKSKSLRTIVKPAMEMFPSSVIMNRVIHKVLPWEEQIMKKDENFFLNNESLFSEFPQSEVAFYSELATSDLITAEDKDEVFDFFICFINLAKAYQDV